MTGPRRRPLTCPGSTKVRCAFGAAAQESMIAEIEAAKKDGDTLGGWSRSSPTACRSVSVRSPAVRTGSTANWPAPSWASRPSRGVEIGDGFKTAPSGAANARRDRARPDGAFRSTNRAGGLEGGSDQAAASESARR